MENEEGKIMVFPIPKDSLEPDLNQQARALLRIQTEILAEVTELKKELMKLSLSMSSLWKIVDNTMNRLDMPKERSNET